MRSFYPSAVPRAGGTHVLGDALWLDVSDEGLERLRRPDCGARWERLLPVDEGGFEIDAYDDCLARYNHAAALVQSKDANNGEEELLLVVGGSDADHMPVETAFALHVVQREG